MSGDTAPASSCVAEALRMLDLFASVGAESFNITHTDIEQQKRGFRRAQTLSQAKGSMPHLVPAAERRRNNLIVRPLSSAATLVQLDDLSPASLARIAPAAFLALQTSEKGVQAWVAVKDAGPGFSARLKDGLGADREASGSTRLAGTLNFKPRYAPHFPVVRIIDGKPGHVVTTADLEALGVVAPEKAAAPAPSPGTFAATSRTSKWPSYQQCLDGAPLGSSGQPKRTSADFVWCKIAISWGHNIDETAARLLDVSTKAKENGERYARQTAEHAEYAARIYNAQKR
jgi:RepB DNA-primase from phage plasmid